MKVLILDIEIGVIFRGNVTLINFPGIDGYFQILKNHAKMFSLLKRGLIELHTLEKEKIIKIKVYNSGLLEVNNNITNILLN